ncbi:MAG TPA: hypothetical protein PK144_06260 [Plasticicumulans sp.]|nr:hypothetical protein [Plasticicumulans sp.]
MASAHGRVVAAVRKLSGKQGRFPAWQGTIDARHLHFDARQGMPPARQARIVDPHGFAAAIGSGGPRRSAGGRG